MRAREKPVQVGRRKRQAVVAKLHLLRSIARRLAHSYASGRSSHQHVPLVGGTPIRETSGIDTLPDIPPKRGGVLVIGINPAPVSVAAGHYYQRRLRQRLWARLERIGLLRDSEVGREDEAFAEAGHGLTDIVKRPTVSAAEPSSQELEEAVNALREKLRTWEPAHRTALPPARGHASQSDMFAFARGRKRAGRADDREQGRRAVADFVRALGGEPSDGTR